MRHRIFSWGGRLRRKGQRATETGHPIGFPEPTILSLHMQLSIVMILCAQTASTGMEGSKTRTSCSRESQVEGFEASRGCRHSINIIRKADSLAQTASSVALQPTQ